MTLNRPLLLQAITGDAAISYSAQEVRTLVDALVIGQGPCTPTDFAVTQRAAGANYSVDVSSGRGIVIGTSVADQGKYVVESTATANVTLAGAPSAGFTRFDLIFAQVRDRQSDGGANYDFVIDDVTGTSSGVVPATPANAFALAKVGPIVSTTASITTALITPLSSAPMPIGGRYGRVVGTPAVRTTGQTGITTIVDLTGLAVTFNALSGRLYEAVARVPVLPTLDGTIRVTVADASNNRLGTGTLAGSNGVGQTVETTVPLSFSTTGPQTVKLRLAKIAGGGSVDFGGDPTEPGYLRILDYS